MDKEVLIHVKGLQMIDNQGEEEPVEIVVPGEYYFRNGHHYLRYEELLDDSGQPTINYIKMSEQGMEVRKKGLVNVQMVFERGKKNMAFYTTPFGTLQMGISATSMEFEIQEQEMRMHVDYSLELEEEHVADCYIDVFVQSKSAKDFSL